MSHFFGTQHTRRNERGAALVEFAMVSFLFMFFIYAVAVFGIILSTKNSLTHAASEGARSALTVSDLPAATLNARRIAQATTTVASSLNHMGSDYHSGDTTATIGTCVGDASHTCLTVTITYPWSTRPMVPLAPGMGLATPNNITATAVVRLS